MKVLVVTSLLPPAGGGAEIAALRQATLLRDGGSEVIIATLRASESAPTELGIIPLAPWNIGSIQDLASYPLPRRVLWHLLDSCNLHGALLFRRILLREKPDVVITHNLKGLGYLLPRTAKRLGVKTIHVLHDVQLIEPSGIAEPEVRMTIIRRLWSAWTRLLIGSPDAVLFPSAWLRDLSRRWHFFQHSRLEVLRNPLTRNGRSAKRGTIRTLAFLGQMEAHKGVRELLAAVRKIAEPYELLMVGDGRLRSWVADEARRNARVRVLGRLTGDALEEAWERTDIIVVPSICAENAPTVIQEATARGIPVIASAVGGIPEFVEEGVTGWLVPVGNVDALRQAIRARPGSAVTEEMRAAMASHAAEWQGERYLKALRDIIASL